MLRGVDLALEVGEFVGAVGPSGSGKTTLVRALTGGCRLLAGQVTIAGLRPPVAWRRGLVGYVPQVGTVEPTFPITVEQVAAQGLIGPGDRREVVAEVLDRLGLSALARRPIGELSGGELQRTFLARALVRRPQVLLLDEPTASVDLRARHDILHLLGELHGEGMTILLTTHDLNFVAAHLPRIVCLAGRVVADGPPAEVFTPEVIRATYGVEARIIHHNGMVFVADPTHILTPLGHHDRPDHELTPVREPPR